MTACDSREPDCHLCGDVAIAGVVRKVDACAGTAIVALPEGDATVAMDLVSATVGDTVLVHMGFAIERVDAA